MQTHTGGHRRLIIFIGILPLLLVTTVIPAVALNMEGRVDTRYKLGSGDGALDHDGYQHHYLNIKLSNNLFIDFAGSLLSDFNGVIDTVSGTVEKTDVALRDLNNVTGDIVDYRVHRAAITYMGGNYTLLMGRTGLAAYENLHSDMVMVKLRPAESIVLEGFAGKPLRGFSAGNYFDVWQDSEIAAGGSIGFSPSEIPISLSLDYLFLREKTLDSQSVGSAAEYYYSGDHISDIALTYLAPGTRLRGSLSGSFHGIDPRDLYGLVTGYNEGYTLSYSGSVYIQFLDVENFGERVNLFSGLLSASRPFLRVQGTCSYDLSALLSSAPWIEASIFELGYSYRIPLESGSESVFNPINHNIRFGTYQGFPLGIYLSLFYDGVFSSGDRNGFSLLSGELAKEWDAFSFRIGSSYNVNEYEADYETAVIEDRFSVQEYYLRMHWDPREDLRLSIKTSYEKAEMKSLTDADYLNEDITIEDATHIITDPRAYLRFELRLSYSF